MGIFRILLVLCLPGGAVFAQLTLDQKIQDFQQLAALYSKQYAPYEWKRDALGFDALRLKPWLDTIRASKDDLEFYEICAQYTASLNDVHTVFLLPSDFFAALGIEVDLYDGRALVEFIDSETAETTAIEIGDELVSIDGRTPAEWIAELRKYIPYGNARSAGRVSASAITFRSQSEYPRAHEVGETARVAVRHAADGQVASYDLRWEKAGLPLINAGPVPTPRVNAAAARRRMEAQSEPEPDYMKPLRAIENFRAPERKSLRGYGAVAPVFAPSMPQGFVRRLGLNSDFFYSGAYASNGKRIGFLRIPDMLAFDGPEARFFAENQFRTEIAFLEANTDALVVDVMRNPGGSGCYAEALARRLIPYRFRGMGYEVRPTREWLIAVSQSIEEAKAFGASDRVIAQLEALFGELRSAYAQNRGRTSALPICADYFERDPPAGPLYTKPVMLLTDEFTTSAAEIFAALFQDSKRGPLMGWRTSGAGGSVSGPHPTGFYSESYSTVTDTLVHRTEQTVTLDFPTTPYLENVGVRPEIEVDYMTEANLIERGKPFVDRFTAEILKLIP